MIKFLLQTMANAIINRMKAISDRTDEKAKEEFAFLYKMGMDLVQFALMGFALELD